MSPPAGPCPHRRKVKVMIIARPVAPRAGAGTFDTLSHQNASKIPGSPQHAIIYGSLSDVISVRGGVPGGGEIVSKVAARPGVIRIGKT